MPPSPQGSSAAAAFARYVQERSSSSASTTPAFDPERAAIDRLEAIAWDAYQEGRKAPRTRKAGPGYADPDYDLSVEWIETRQRLQEAQARWQDAATPSRFW